MSAQTSAVLRNSKLDIVPLTGTFGAEILNIDLSVEQPEHVWAEIRNAFTDWGVIFFRDQKLTEAQQLEFARHFGSTTYNPNMPAVGDYEDLGIVAKDVHQKNNIGNAWHTDQSARAHPVRSTILLCHDAPKFGGDTCFISTSLAYEALSDGLKETLGGLKAIHTEALARARYKGNNDATRAEAAGPAPEATHPVIITLPESGKKALYVNPGKTLRFEGWTPEESEPLLKYLYQHCQKPEFFCRFRYREGSMAMWDNYQTWHYAVNDYHGQRRVMHRTTTLSDLFR